jgi:hypothetical protein
MHSAATLTFGARLAALHRTERQVASFFNVPHEVAAKDVHVPGDTTTPPAPDAVQIGPTDVS